MVMNIMVEGLSGISVSSNTKRSLRARSASSTVCMGRRGGEVAPLAAPRQSDVRLGSLQRPRPQQGALTLYWVEHTDSTGTGMRLNSSVDTSSAIGREGMSLVGSSAHVHLPNKRLCAAPATLQATHPCMPRRPSAPGP